MAFLIKLTVIFFGSGLMTLFAFWVGKEVSTIPKLILSSNKNKKEKLSIVKERKISSTSGVYEILLTGEPIKIFSSHKGMRVV